jgi:hypothetical protein
MLVPNRLWKYGSSVSSMGHNSPSFSTGVPEVGLTAYNWNVMRETTRWLLDSRKQTTHALMLMSRWGQNLITIKKKDPPTWSYPEQFIELDIPVIYLCRVLYLSSTTRYAISLVSSSAWFFPIRFSYACCAVSCKKNNSLRRNKFSRGLNKLVATVPRLRAEQPRGCGSIPYRGNIVFCFTKWPNRLWSPPTQPSPIPWVSTSVSAVLKGRGDEADDWTPI